MDVLIPLLAGLLVGFLLGWSVRATQNRDEGDERRGFRPNKRQRKILATLPRDPELPTIEDLVREEAQDLGVDAVEGGDVVPLHVRLRVWKRDRPHLGDCPEERLRFVIARSVRANDATAADVRLTCADPGEAAEIGNEPGPDGV